MYPLPCLYACRTSCPEPEGPRTAAWATFLLRKSMRWAPAFSTRHQAQCHSKRWGLHTPQKARHDGAKRPGHLMGMATARRTAPTRAPRRPAKPTAAGQHNLASTTRPGKQARNASRQPHRRVRGGGTHQHPLRHRKPAGDGLREGPPAPPQERSQRREVGPKAAAPGLRA